jgi:hypothetical protein
LARALAEHGVFDEGNAHGQEAIRTAEAVDHPFSVVVGCLDLAYLKSVRGELSQAARLLERAVAQCREWNITSHTPIAMAALGHVYAWSGRIEEGVSCLPYTPSTRTTLPLAVRNRSAFSARYSSESYQRRACSMLGNSVTTMRFGFQSPSSVCTWPPRTRNVPPYFSTVPGTYFRYSSNPA